ncbi:gliding motility-associated C-terminal domain-containing protein [Flavobacterium sp. 11]|uniref:HYR-like domain-containing protein n=1 Tax=Flavobacterium sp. 11 TaxID=357523 RepID=UPI000C187E27|nr:gliding motility-associated C-terminal domain-containing protein [Flavobacterium sp. 11]PIF63100.1 gliding motility-associated-like protein [Flavobacterium sp. 11]
MKTKITLLLLALFMFAGNIYSQIDAQHPDLRSCNYSCPSGNVTAKNVYLSATINDGTPLEDVYPTCIAGVDTYSVTIWLNYTQNQNNDIPNTRVFATLSIGGGTPMQINTYVGTLASTKGTSGGKIKLTTVPVNWVCGQTLSFTNVLVVWKPGNGDSELNANSTYDCQTYSNSQCEFGTTTVFTAPLAVQYDYSTSCATNSGVAVQFSNKTNGGKAPFTYLWNFGDGTTSTAISPLHNYTTTGVNVTATLTVTDSRTPIPATNTVSKTINLPNKLITSISQQTNVSCNGGNNGSLTTMPSGGTLPYTYLWNSTPIQTSATATGLASGTYTITVTDAKGCITTSSATITQPAALLTSTTTTNVLCNGTNGAIDLSVSGGTAPYTYLWSNGAISQDLDSVVAGTYNVTITDTNNCTTTASATVTEPANALAASATATAVLCKGGNGAVDLSVSGGTAPYTYLWSNGAISQDLDSVVAGTYNVTITDTNNCTTTASATVTEPANALAASATATAVLCKGGNGAVDLSVSGGTAPYTYLWSNGAISQDLDSVVAGTYNVTITDTNNCTTTASATVTEPANALAASATATAVLCKGGNGAVDLSVSGGTAPYTYLWSNGAISQDLDSVVAGTYNVTITDTNNCTTTASATVTEPANALAASATATAVLCKGGNGAVDLSVSGGTAPYTYLWSNGAISQDLASAVAGTYNVTITDTNNCTTTASATVTEPADALAASATATAVLCKGGNGAVDLSVSGGTAPYTYLWSNGAISQDLDSVVAGTYNVTITDTNNCTTTASATVTEPANALAASATATAVLCKGGNGAVDLSVSGGTAPYTYLWSNGAISQDLASAVAGTYNVTITDTNNCTTTASATVTEPANALAASATATAVLCKGGNGAVDLSVSGGTAPYTYLWSNGAISQDLDSVVAGTYNVTITDTNNCTTTASATVTEPANALAASATATAVLCKGGNGAVDLSVSGGTAPYTYLWSNGAISQDLDSVVAGTYNVTITDTNNCTTTASATVTEPANALAASATATAVLCKGGNGAVDLSVSGGTAPYTYLWSNGAISQDLDSVVAGTYNVTITDTNNCTTTASATVTEPANALAASATATAVLCKGGNGAVDLSVSGGTAPYTYLWSNGAISQDLDSVVAGTYNVTITDTNNCTTTASATVTEPANALAASATATAVLCKGGNGAVDLSVSGGTAPYTYLWSNGAISQDLDSVVAGTYNVTITDTNNCTTTASATVTEPANALAASATATAVLCKGGNGAVDLSVSGGTAPYTYLWSNGAISQDLDSVVAGTYNVTITDTNNCTTTASATVTDGDGTPPVISQLPNEITINCPAKPEFAEASATDYVDTSVSLTFDDVTTKGQCAGSYSVTRTWKAVDDCGNSSTKSQTINVQDITAPTFTVPANITINAGANCIANVDPSTTGTVTNIKDTCDSNPAVSYSDTDCFGTADDTEINAGNGNYFPFTISGYDGLSASKIENIALTFETNQGKGRAEFTLVAPNGQAVILVGPYCEGGNCDDASPSSTETYSPVFYPNSSGYTQWNNNNNIQEGVSLNFTPNGATTSTNTITGLTSFVSSFENLTGLMNGTWFIFSRKQASVNGSIKFKSVCMKPASECAGNKIISRTWTVTDACGNKTTANQTIKIQDNTAPILSEVPIDVTVECNAVPEAAILTATDNCDANPVVSYKEVKSNMNETCASNYTLTRTWIAKDACGNESSKSQVITVKDTTAPVFAEALPANVTVQCSAVPTAPTLTATDNCGDATVTFSQTSTPGLCAGAYTLTRTWTAKDACGLTATHTQIVTVEDTTAPVFVEALPANVTVQCSAVPTAPTLTATDNCGDATVTFSQTSTPGLCAGAYTLTRTWTAKDACGLTATHTQIVTVEDTTAPVFVEALPANVTVQCSAVPTAPTLTATDNCGDATVTFSQTSTPGLCAGAYTLTRTWTAKDACGLTATHTQIVTVEDTTAPVFVEALPANVTVQCSAVPTAPTLTATDNCGDATVTFSQTSTPGLCAGAYTLTRTWTAKDACGLTATHTQIVTVEDTTAPVFVEALPANVTVQCSAVPTAPTLTATDNCGDATVTFSQTSTPGLCAGAYTLTRTWTAKDACGLTATHTQIVTVEDTTAPVFVEALPANVTVQCSAVPTAPTLTATDNCGDATVTFSQTSTPGLCAGAYTLTRTWTAKDACGLTATHTQIVTVEDTTAPVFVEALPANVTVQCSAVPTAPTLTATDNCGDATVTFSQTSTPGLCAGAYTLTRTWTAKDACGLTATHTQIVTVEDTTAPVFVEALPANVTVQCSAVPTAPTLTATDNCGDATVTFSQTSTPGLCAGAYTLTRTWTAKDACGLTATHTQIVTVEDTTAPVFVEALPANVTVQCSAVPTAPTLTATDNCGDATVTFSQTSTPGLCAGAYTLTRTWTAKDACGLTATHTQIVTVEDTTAPVFVEALPANVTVQCSAVPTAPTLTATDNCGDATVTFSQTSTPGLCAGAYTLTRTWTAKDACGLTATHTQIVTVEDTTAPVFVEALPANVTVQCSAVPTAPTLTATDNCGDATVTFSQTSTPGLCAGAYTLTRTWTAKDACGLTATHTQIVTVEDTTAPVFVEALPVNVTVQCSAVPTAPTLTATDNCGDATVTFSQTSTPGLCAGAYTLTRTWTAKDACGLTATHTQIVTVEDTTAPVFVEALPANVTVQCSAVPTAPTLTATDNCGDATVTFSQTSTPGLCAGAYTLTRTWTAKDACGLTATHTQIVTVEDTTAPVFVEALPANVTVQCSAVPTAPTLTATDNCGDATVTFSQTSTPGLCAGAYTLTRTWTAKDACENVATTSQTINVIDTTGPITTTEFNTTVNTNCNSIPVKPDLVFVDNCSTVTTAVYSETIINKTDNSYSIVRKWSVSDTCGNTSEFIQIINVAVTNSIVSINGSVCNSGEITTANLRELLPLGTPTNGTWIDVNNSGSLQGDIFNASGLTGGNYTFEYKIDNACSETIRINMTIDTDCGGIVLACGTVLVHNAFSPNGDGINEKFIIDNIDDTVCYPENTVEIYNRWGVLVFETKGYNNTSNVFDGISGGRSTIQQSSGLPTGTYFYILNYTSVDNDGKIITNKKDGYLYLTK